MMRTFLALDIPENLHGTLQLLQYLLPLPSALPPASFHITLSYLNALPDAVLESVHDAIPPALAALPPGPFDLTLSGTGLFGSKRPRAVWAGVQDSPALTRLQTKLETAARQAGAIIPSARYLPHVTLSRMIDPRLPAEAVMRLEQAIIAEMGFRAGPFRVQDVVLYASLGTAHQPRYEMLQRYPLISA